MKTTTIIIHATLILLFFCNSTLAGPLLIVNASVEETVLGQDEVQLIFLGKKKKWTNGGKIHVVTLKQGPLHEAFLKTYVKKTPAKFSSYWKIATVTGTGMPPKSFGSEEALMTYVAGKEGAVGYVSSNTPVEGVQLISIK